MESWLLAASVVLINRLLLRLCTFTCRWWWTVRTGCWHTMMKGWHILVCSALCSELCFSRDWSLCVNGMRTRSGPARMGCLGSCCLHFSLTRMLYQNGTEAVALLLSSAIGMERDTKKRLSKRASCDAESAVHETAATIKRRFMFWRNYGTSLVSSHPAFSFYIVVADVIDFFIRNLWTVVTPSST